MTEAGPAKSRLNTDRQLTLHRIAGLERDFAAIVTSAGEGAAGGDDEHDPEGATVAFERQHVAALLAQAREHIEAIDAALAKIGSGIYEICDICHESIEAERLIARPTALVCVRCARAGRPGRHLPGTTP